MSGRTRTLVALAAVGVLAGVGLWWWLRRPPAAVVPALSAPSRPVAVSVPAIPFADVTQAAGIVWSRETGASGERLLPESLGGSAAFFDLENDGDPDLLLVNGDVWPEDPRRSGPRPTSALFRNDGGGRFTDITAEAGLARLHLQGMGVATGDVDNDGWTDLVLTGVGDLRLLRNEGGRLRDAAVLAGLAASEPGWTSAAAFLDIDRDGDLDLAVGRYVRWSRAADLASSFTLTGLDRAYGPPTQFPGATLALFENQGDGTFRDVSAARGVEIKNPATGVPVTKILGLLPFDADGDGHQDLFVASDTTQNLLLRNRGDGHFEDVGVASGMAFDRLGGATGAMGVDVAWPYDGNADPLVVVGNFANEMSSAYLRQATAGAIPMAPGESAAAPVALPPVLFADEAMALGLGGATRTVLTFGVLALDADLDGRPDLVQTNGHLEPEIERVDPSQRYAQPAQLFWNTGSSPRYALVPAAASGDLAAPSVGRGSAAADVDGDGDLDLVTMQVAGSPRLLRNDQALGHHWLRLDLIGDPAKGTSRDAAGALVEVLAGGRWQRQQVNTARSYLSASERTLTFGLGGADRAETVRIQWPGGGVTELAAIAADQRLRIEQTPPSGASQTTSGH